METGLTAREYLSRDPVLHIDMLENLRRGAQRLLYEGNDGVLLHDTESDCYILSAPSPEAGRRLLALAGSPLFVCAHQRFTVDELALKYDFPFYLDCFQAAYLSAEPLPVPPVCEFRQLLPEDAQWVNDNYRQDPQELGYVRSLLEKGVITGAFVDGERAGFIGRHSEGSMGLLEVLPEYRRRGVGEALLRDAVNRELALGHIPFGQVVWDNEPSLALHRKLGFTMSEGHVWWLDMQERK